MRRKVKNVVVGLGLLAMLKMVSLGHAGSFSDDFDGYGTLADSEQVSIVGQNGWVGSAVDSSTDYNAYVTGNWGGPHPAAGTGGVDALAMGNGYNHIAQDIGNLSVGDQISVMFNVWGGAPFGEIWIGNNKLVDNDVSANNESAIVLQMGAGAGNSISYGFYQQASGQTLGNPPATSGGNHSGPDKATAGNVGWWTQVRMTMLNLGGNSTWGIDSALVETRNITAWDKALSGDQNYAHVDGSWVSLGNMHLNPDGIGDGDQSDSNNSVYLVLGGEDVHFDNLLVTPEPTSLGLLLVGAAGLFSFRRRR